MPAKLTKSYETVNYLIRPSKQVERKLFIEVLHKMGEMGYGISKYCYIGLGSVFYADFQLFHKYLYIDKMICAEASEIQRRMQFNKPYGFIQLKMCAVGELVPRLSRTKKYVAWLDYDCGLSSEILEDIQAYAGKLSPGSILLVTVDAEPRLQDREEEERLSRRARYRELTRLYNQEFRPHLERSLKVSDISRPDLPHILAKVMKSAITDVVTRRGLTFLQLFNFQYADGAQMLTMGGVIADDNDVRKFEGSDIYKLDYIVAGDEPKRITVPPLTPKEKQWIDSQIKADRTLSTRTMVFELDRDLLENYLQFYRYYPSYYEALV